MTDITTDPNRPKHWWQNPIGQTDPLDGAKILDEIKVSSFATVKSLVGYSKDQRAHPERNQPDLVRALLTMYMPAHGAYVWDPMCGSGTTIQEANRLGATLAGGWDSWPAYRALWLPHAVQYPKGVTTITMSPPYPEVNHSTGDTKMQRDYSQKRGSKQGTRRPNDPNAIGRARTYAGQLFELIGKYQECYDALAPGGVLCTIVKDRVKNDRIVLFSKMNMIALEHAGFPVLGKHPRRMRASNWYHSRAAWRIKNDVPGIEPLICTEWIYIAKRPE